jgi:hypothetical protein
MTIKSTLLLEEIDTPRREPDSFSEPVVPRKLTFLDDDNAAFESERGLTTSWDDFNLVDSSWLELSLVSFWNKCLGLTAFLDFSANMADNYFRHKHGLLSRAVGHEPWVESAVASLLAHATIFSFLFSAMWFLDAFTTAYSRRHACYVERDRQRLLGLDNQATRERMYNSPQGVYWITISTQLLLLPVGFYVICYAWLRRASDDENVVLEIVHHSDKDALHDDNEVFARSSTISLGFALLKHALIALSRRLGMHLKALWRHLARIGIKRLAFRAVRNPFRFGHRVHNFLRIVRWIQYLLPLIATGNKLRENLEDLLKKRRQHREATSAQRARQKRWDRLTKLELRDDSAILIQKTYRGHQARRKVVALQLLMGRKENIAACKLQTAFRHYLKQARLRLACKREELKLLEKKVKRLNRGQPLDDDERRRMYVLQNELEEEANELINEKLLLRPNTTFAVAWKVLFVFAVIFEISQLAFQPLLSKNQDQKGNPLGMEGFFEHLLIPTAVSALPECNPQQKRGPVGFVTSLLLGNPRQAKKPAKAPPPWYCKSTIYSILQSKYSDLITWSIQSFLDIVGFVCFLDVFITFFTGEYNKMTGRLEPKPFFQRWVLPGLCLQLLINPTMDTTSDIVCRAIKGLFRRGPSRVLRWTVALFFPVGKQLIRLVRRLWIVVVDMQNQQVTAMCRVDMN